MKALLRLCLLLLLPICQPHAAERVVSLAPSITELLQDLQAEHLLVGVLEAGEIAASLDHVPRVGRLGQLDLEKLLQLQPDLVLNWPGSVGARQLQQLDNLGIEVLTLSARNMQQLANQFELLGNKVGQQQRGQQLAAAARQQLAQLHSTYQRQSPIMVFYQLWDKPMYSLGGNQIISDALTYCGAQNVLADMQVAAPQVNLESVLALQPQVVLMADEQLRRSWQGIEQVRLLTVPNRGLERPSWQMLAALEQLCQELALIIEE